MGNWCDLEHALVAKPCTFVATGLPQDYKKNIALWLHYDCKIAMFLQSKCNVIKMQSKCNNFQQSKCNWNAIKLQNIIKISLFCEILLKVIVSHFSNDCNIYSSTNQVFIVNFCPHIIVYKPVII